MTVRKVSLILVAAALVFALTGCGLIENLGTKIGLDTAPPVDLFGFGRPEGGLTEVAAHLTSSKLVPYHNWRIVKIEFYLKQGNRLVTVAVYDSGSTPGALLLSEGGGTDNQGLYWQTIRLNSPVTIDSSRDLWIAYRTDTDSNGDPPLTPIGVDTGTAVEPFTNYYRAYSGGSGTWYPHSGSNFIIRAILEPPL